MALRENHYFSVKIVELFLGQIRNNERNKCFRLDPYSLSILDYAENRIMLRIRSC